MYRWCTHAVDFFLVQLLQANDTKFGEEEED
jgi:hypothetical protein